MAGDIKEDLRRQVNTVHGNIAHEFRMELLPDEGLDEAQHDDETQDLESSRR